MINKAQTVSVLHTHNKNDLQAFSFWALSLVTKNWANHRHMVKLGGWVHKHSYIWKSPPHKPAQHRWCDTTCRKSHMQSNFPLCTQHIVDDRHHNSTARILSSVYYVPAASLICGLLPLSVLLSAYFLQLYPDVKTTISPSLEEAMSALLVLQLDSLMGTFLQGSSCVLHQELQRVAQALA